MKINYKENSIEARLYNDSQEGFEDEIRFVHPMTGEECEMFSQVFQGWSERNNEDNQILDQMKELFSLNQKDIYMRLFDECDVNLESYEEEKKK